MPVILRFGVTLLEIGVAIIEESMNKDDNMIPFYKDHGFGGDWSNVIESTYDLLRVLEYCVSDQMNYTPETKARIQDLIDWIRTGEGDGTSNHLTSAINSPLG